jgi:signal transduction histidine kinase
MGILTFIVKDEGKGFAQGHVSGNGLANMKCRMEEIGGDFLLSHEQGTTVLFSLALA